MDEDFFLALMSSSVAALCAAMHAWNALAKAGLIDPADVDGMLHGLIAPFDECGDGPAVQKVRSVFEAVLDPQLAALRILAESTWRGPRA